MPSFSGTAPALPLPMASPAWAVVSLPPPSSQTPLLLPVVASSTGLGTRYRLFFFGWGLLSMNVVVYVVLTVYAYVSVS